MRWLFRRKDPAAKLLGLLSDWHIFETVELDRPELADKLADFALRFEQELPEAKSTISARAESGTPEDINFIFDILSRLPVPPETLRPLPTDPAFDWKTADEGLGMVGRVVNRIRVTVQQRAIAPYEKEFLRQRGDARRGLEDELRARLAEIDGDYRTVLSRVLKLYELYDHCLGALAAVKSPEGIQEIIAHLSAGTPPERVFALRALLRAGWEPKNLEQALDFHLARAKLSENESARKQAEKELEKLVRQLVDARELIEKVEPRLAEEGLLRIQGLGLLRLAEIDPALACDRFSELLGRGDEPAELKTAAVQALQEIVLPVAPGPAVQLLLRALDDLNMEVRVKAAAALTRLPENTPPEVKQQALERLIFALRDGDLEVRAAAAKALNPKIYPDAPRRLAEFLTAETNPNGREFAARALGMNFPALPETTVALTRALSDEDAAVRKAAADALAAQGAVPTEPGVRMEFLCAKQEWAALANAGKAALPSLLPRLRDLREDIRLAAVRTLGKIGAREAVKEVCIALSDASREVRKAAAKALLEIGAPEAAPALKTALTREGFQDVRLEMERALRKLQSSA